MGKRSDRPRGRSSSYSCFVKTCKEEHERQHPGVKLDFREFSKKCSQKWNEMSPKEKKLFEEMSEKDKIRYEQEMANYVPQKGEKTKKRKRRRDPDQPKRALSAFFFFCKDERPSVTKEFPDMKISEIASELGKRWQILPPEEKSRHEVQAGEDKKRYEQDMAIFRAKKLKKESIPVPKKKTKKEESEEEEEEEAPEEEEEPEEEEDDDDDDDE